MPSGRNTSRNGKGEAEHSARQSKNRATCLPAGAISNYEQVGGKARPCGPGLLPGRVFYTRFQLPTSANHQQICYSSVYLTRPLLHLASRCLLLDVEPSVLSCPSFSGSNVYRCRKRRHGQRPCQTGCSSDAPWDERRDVSHDSLQHGSP